MSALRGTNRFDHPVPGDITPAGVYARRRECLQIMAAGAGGALLAAWAQRSAHGQGASSGALARLTGSRRRWKPP